MVRKNPEETKEYQRKYYKKYFQNPVNRNRNRLNQRKNYWRKKYCMLAGISEEEFKQSFRNSWNIEQLKSNTIAIQEINIEQVKE